MKEQGCVAVGSEVLFTGPKSESELESLKCYGLLSPAQLGTFIRRYTSL